MHAAAQAPQHCHANAACRYGVGLVDSWNISVAMNEAHINVRQSYEGKMDCVHFCRPGMPEVSFPAFLQLFRDSNPQPTRTRCSWLASA